MSATYPNSVRQFSPKQDATMFVLAAHVNDLQDEVASIERTVGTVPAEWDNGPTLVKLYPTVKARLDDIQNTITIIQGQITSILTQLSQIGPLITRVGTAETNISNLQAQVISINNSVSALQAQISNHEQRIISLENSTGNLPSQIQNLQSQINSLQTGAVASILDTGQVIHPDPYQYTILNWNSMEYDNVGIFSGGTGLICPQDGWWLVNLFGSFPNTGGDPSGNFCQATLQLRNNGNDIASESATMELGLGGRFRMSVPWAGPWYRGSIMTAAVNFNPYSGPSPSITGRISFTRLHGL